MKTLVPQSNNSAYVSAAYNSSSISPNNDPSLISYNKSTSYIFPAPLQPTVIVDDASLPLDTTTFVNLQPCPFDLVPESSLPQQTSVTREAKSHPIHQDFIDTRKISPVLLISIYVLRLLTFQAVENCTLSTPIVAVRRVIDSFFSEHDIQSSMSKSSSSRCRGSRLENKVCLNITDDEYVISKLKEKEQKQTLSRQRRYSQDKTFTSRNKRKAKKYRKTTATAEKENKENETPNDSQIAATVQRPETVIQYAQTIFDSDMSEEF